MTEPEGRQERIAARLDLADKHEALALQFAVHTDGGSTTKAAAHFAVADALRARARFA